MKAEQPGWTQVSGTALMRWVGVVTPGKLSPEVGLMEKYRTPTSAHRHDQLARGGLSSSSNQHPW